MGLELAWGKVRRAFLRAFRPGYVRRMQALRQGNCPDCRHAIIDGRDLKFFKNVCGFSFRREDDRFTWRGRLGLARYGLAEVVFFSFLFLFGAVLCGCVALWINLAFLIPLVLLLSIWVFVLSFFRDPKRQCPKDVDALVSPADGVVTHLEETECPDFPHGRAFRVSIFLSVFNVHVNRLPRTGRITGLRYFPGLFLDARNQDCHARNEQLWIDMEDSVTGCPIRVKQIAGAIARRIVCWLREGEAVTAGDRFGMIKFGSRTDVLLPPSAVADVLVKVGQPVKGGSQILLRLKPKTVH
jgi:phosphatidylserine decarboxylase